MVELNREYLVDLYKNDRLIDLTMIDLSFSYDPISKIDSNRFKRLTKLEKFKKINSNTFESLSNLDCLSLFGNKLKRIDSKTFKGLTELVKLDLDRNEIEEIDVRSFESLSNLRFLYLQDNKLKRIDSNTFKGLSKLEHLFFLGNEIEEIDVKSFESLSNLKYLRLQNNKLKRIDSNTFIGLTKLEELDMYDNVIEKIDVRSFESLSNLTCLYLNNNKLKEIGVRSFESLSNLKVLHLNNNKLKEIDRKCFEPLRSIEVIQIYENEGLNALSFIKPSANRNNYNEKKVKEYGSISEWNQFLQQFPQLVIQGIYSGQILNDRYKVERKLGKGAFGSVYLVDDTKIHIEKLKKKAIKIMDELDEATKNELELFSETIHENIVRYFDHFHMKIEDEDKTFLITEFCQNGDLKKKIEETKRLNIDFEDKQILGWIRQATNALSYLHSRKPKPIIHRDIKPENMLLSGKNEIKLGDLGLSKLMKYTYAKTFAGTPLYMSPEVFKAYFIETKYYPNTDVWSLGCVLYELIFLTLAFPQGPFADPLIQSKVSSSGKFSSVLSKMLEKDCLKRITSQKLFTELENL